MKRAIIIRTYGDPETANGLANAVVVNAPSSVEPETVKAELQAMKQREAALAVRQVRDRDYWYCKIKDAEWEYGDNPKHGKVSAAVLGAVGLVCETVNRCYRYLSAWNRNGERRAYDR